MREDVKLSAHVGSVVDRNRFNVDPNRDPDLTFHFDAIPDPDPSPSFTNSDLLFSFNHITDPDPSPSFTNSDLLFSFNHIRNS
jgi:hypothetical protein